MLNGMPTYLNRTASDAVIASTVVEESEAIRKARQRFAADVERMWFGNFEQFVKDLLQSRFHKKTFAEMALQHGISTRINVMRDAIDKLNVAVVGAGGQYHLAPREGGDFLEDARFDKFIKALSMDDVAREASAGMWRQPVVAAMPIVSKIERTGTRRIGVRLMTPECFDIVTCDDFPGEWEAFRMFEDEGEYQEMTEIRADFIREYKRRRDGEHWVLTEEEPNPYGCIPVVLFRRDRTKVWSSNYGPMLFETTLECNAAETLFSYNSSSDAKIITGAYKDMASGQRIKHGAIVDDAGANGSVQDLTLDGPKWRQAYVESPRSLACVSLGLPPDEFQNTTIPPSGESLKLRYWGRTLRAQEHRASLLPALEELYWVALQVLRVEFDRKVDEDGEPLPAIEGFASVADLPPYETGRPISEQSVRFVCDFEDVSIPETEDERQKRIDFDLRMNFTTPANELKKADPSIEDAQGVIDANAKINEKQRKRNAPVLPMRPAQPVAPMSQNVGQEQKEPTK